MSENEGLRYEEVLIIPSGTYTVEVMSWEPRVSAHKEQAYAQVRLQVIEGPFEGRKLFMTIVSNDHLAIVVQSLEIEQNNDMTARAALDAMVGEIGCAHVVHEVVGNKKYAKPASIFQKRRQ